MAKKMGSHYFPHDFGARNDTKLVNVMMDHGVAGIGVYWCIIEMLYEEGGELSLAASKHIAFALHVSHEVVDGIIRDFGLFSNDGANFWSNAVNERIEKRMEIAQKRRDAIAKRWGKEENNTNVSESEYKSNTNVSETDTIEPENGTKKSKEKKRKEKERKVNDLSNLNNNVVLCKNSESAADGDTKQQDKREIERYFFVERRWIQAERIAERFWNLNASFDWQTAKGKVKNPIYAAKLWKPAPEEMGGHACDNKLLAGKYFDFVKSVEHLHPEAWKLLREFNNIQVETDGTIITYNDSTAGDILDTILINNRETAFRAFRASFGAKKISYLTNE